MHRVAVYFPTYNEKHEAILRDFAAGVPGAVVKPYEQFRPGEADIGVVFGWYKYAFKPTMAKRPIIDYYLSLGKRHLIVVESAFQLRAKYFQVGWDGFAGYADFCNEAMPADRWNGLGLKVTPWQDRPDGPAVVIGQLPRDTQVQDVDHIAWCREAVEEAKRVHGSVIFRPHPRCDDIDIFGIDREIIDLGKLRSTLSKAKCVITWNSTTGVDALIAGVPVVAMEHGSVSWPLASHSIDAPLVRPTRSQWLAGIGYSQWERHEMREGLPWNHLTR